MSTILTYGTFDLFHVGHVRLLKRARELGSKLIVGVSTDEFNRKKGKLAINSYEDRCEILLSSLYVDAVFPEESWEQKVHDIERFSVSTFVMGSDWAKQFDYLNFHCQVVYLCRTDGISSTEIKENVAKGFSVDCRSGINANEQLESRT